MALDHHQTKGLGPGDGKQQRPGIAQEFLFLAVIDLADEFHMRTLVQERPNHFVEIGLVDRIHLGRDLERHAGPAAISIASTGPLSAQMRPRKAR